MRALPCMDDPGVGHTRLRMPERHAAVEPGVTPDTSDGRERIARLEGQIDDVERQVERNERTFGPLPMAVERLQWTIDSIITRLDKRDREDDERFERLTRSFENQISACSNAVGKVAEQQQLWQEGELARREQLAQTAKDRKVSDRTSRRAMWGLIGAAAVTGILGLITQMVTALS